METKDTITHFDTFDPATEEWTDYIERLEAYFNFNDVDDTKKVSAIISLMGASTFKLLKDLVSPKKPSEMEYEAIVEILKEYFTFNPLQAGAEVTSECLSPHSPINVQPSAKPNTETNCQPMRSTTSGGSKRITGSNFTSPVVHQPVPGASFSHMNTPIRTGDRMAKKAKNERKTNRQSWSEDIMASAIQAVLSGRMGYKKASALFSLPQSTLGDRVKKARKNELSAETAAKKGLGAIKSTFSDAQEKELVEHILKLEERLFGLTLTDVRELAFEFAERKSIPHKFNKVKKMAGKDWLYSFLSRNPIISLRNLKKTSLARAKDFNHTVVQKFFTLLQSIYEKNQLSACDVYNVDETGILTVPNKPSSVLALRGKKQVGCLNSAEEEILVTVEMCMNAAGNFMPPMFIFPTTKANPLLLDDAPPGSFAVYNKSGQISKEIFLVWFRKFVAFSNPSEEKPVLLILDGHSSHVKSIELINTARKNHVILLCFPPHTTHRLQPLDVSLMAPLSAFYEQEVRKWLINHPGHAMTINQTGHLFRAAYLMAAIPQTAVKGFEKTGIYPFNSDIFTDDLFAPSNTSEKSMEIEDNTLTKQHQDESLIPNNPFPYPPQIEMHSKTVISSQTDEGKKSEILKIDVQQPSSSNQDLDQAMMSSFSISPLEIRPLPVQKKAQIL